MAAQRQQRQGGPPSRRSSFPSPSVLYLLLQDIAFFYLAMAVVAMAVLPWSLFKLCFAISDACRQPQLIPLTRIQKLKLAQNQAAKAAAASAAGGVGVIGAPAPVTVQPQGSPSAGEDGAAAAAAAKSNAAASGLTQENLKPPAPWFSCGNVTLALLWVLFIFMLLQIPSFKNENLASFKPFEILGVDPKAGDDEIKKVDEPSAAARAALARWIQCGALGARMRAY